METFKILLSLQAPEFISLKNPKLFAGQPEYIGLPPAALPSQMLERYEAIYTALTGETMPSDTFIQARNQEGKGITKLYGPALYRGTEPNTLTIRWGNEYIPLTLGKNSIAGPVENEDLSFEFSWEKIQYDEPTLLVKLDVDEDMIVLPVVVKDVDWNNPIGEEGISQIKRHLEKGKIEKILEMVAEPGNGGSSNGDPVDPRDMTTGGVFTITKVRSIKTKHGGSYIITVVPQVGDPQIAERGEEWDMWGHNGINSYLDAGVQLPVKFELDHTPNKKDETKMTARFALIDETYAADAQVVSLDTILG